MKGYTKETLLNDIENGIKEFNNCLIMDVTMFNSSEMQGLGFHNCTFMNCKFINNNFSNSHFINCTINQCNMRLSNFNNCNFTNTNITNSKITSARFINTELCHARIEVSNFSNCNFSSSRIVISKLNDSNFSNCNFILSQLIGLDVFGSDFSNSNVEDSYRDKIPYFCLQCPEDGPFNGFMKVKINNINYIAKILIPQSAKRTSATTRLCRCSRATLLSIIKINSTDPDITELVINNNSINIFDSIVDINFDSFSKWSLEDYDTKIGFYITKEEAINSLY